MGDSDPCQSQIDSTGCDFQHGVAMGVATGDGVEEIASPPVIGLEGSIPPVSERSSIIVFMKFITYGF